jgi:aminopeptidase 2
MEETAAPPISEREILPKTLKPIHYDLQFEPDLDKGNEFQGSVVIEIEVLEPTSIVTLNTAALKIHTTSITTDGKTIDFDTSSLSFDESTKRVTISLNGELKAGEKVYVKQTFTGSLLHPSEGFFRAPYPFSCHHVASHVIGKTIVPEEYQNSGICLHVNKPLNT